jgi:hypothetical protein
MIPEVKDRMGWCPKHDAPNAAGERPTVCLRGGMECDASWVQRNKEACVWFLENASLSWEHLIDEIERQK